MAKKVIQPKKTAPKKAIKAVENTDDGIHSAARPFLWLGSHRVQHGFIWVVGALAVLFIGLDFTFHRHGHFSWETSKGFYAVFGFLAFSFAVLMGGPLRKITGRAETYYDADEGAGENVDAGVDDV